MSCLHRPPAASGSRALTARRDLALSPGWARQLPDFVYTCFMVTPYGNVLRFLPPLVFGDDLLDDSSACSTTLLPSWPADMGQVDRGRLAELTDRATRRFIDAHPRCAQLHRRASSSMPAGVPMSWMAKWAGPFPVYVDSAAGASFRCADGRDHVDFCLGDTGAMTGHSPPRRWPLSPSSSRGASP